MDQNNPKCNLRDRPKTQSVEKQQQSGITILGPECSLGSSLDMNKGSGQSGSFHGYHQLKTTIFYHAFDLYAQINIYHTKYILCR